MYPFGSCFFVYHFVHGIYQVLHVLPQQFFCCHCYIVFHFTVFSFLWILSSFCLYKGYTVNLFAHALYMCLSCSSIQVGEELLSYRMWMFSASLENARQFSGEALSVDFPPDVHECRDWLFFLLLAHAVCNQPHAFHDCQQ